jgi:predicted HicB family RNase H-like nuclease
MEDYLHKKLKIQAATDSTTINDVVNEAIKMYLHNKCKNI